MYLVRVCSVIWKQAGHQYTVYIWKHCCNKVVFQISHKSGMDYFKKQGKGGGAVNIELTGVSKMNS